MDRKFILLVLDFWPYKIKKFTKDRGFEYFSGDINAMKKLFMELINRHDVQS